MINFSVGIYGLCFCVVILTEDLPDFPKLIVDLLSFKPILLNLLSNAIKYNRLNSRVQVAVRQVVERVMNSVILKVPVLARPSANVR